MIKSESGGTGFEKDWNDSLAPLVTNDNVKYISAATQ